MLTFALQTGLLVELDINLVKIVFEISKIEIIGEELEVREK